MKPVITIRPTTPDDGPSVVALRRRVIELGVPEKNEIDYWRWENLLPPSGPALGVVAECEGVIVASAAGLRRSLCVEGRLQPAFHVVDVMTDPSHRSGTTFLRLLVSLQKRLLGDGARYLFAFPNANSRLFFQQLLKWRPVGNASVMVRPFGTGRLWREKAPAALRWLWPVSMAARFLPPWGARPEEMIPVDASQALSLPDCGEIGVARLHRTPEEFSHRFTGVPGRGYEVLCMAHSAERPGHVVTRLLRLDGLSLGVILELEGVEPGARRALVAAALRRFSERGCDAALALTMGADPVRNDYLWNSFLPLPPFVAGSSMELMVKEPDDEQPGRRPQWRVSWGLNDVF